MSSSRIKAWFPAACLFLLISTISLLTSGCGDAPPAGDDERLGRQFNPSGSVINDSAFSNGTFTMSHKPLVKHTPGASSAASTSGTGTVVLVQQADCSISALQVAVAGTGSSMTFQVTASTANVQDQFHSQAGLNTTGDRWPNGCKAPTGIAASTIVYLGPAKDGTGGIFAGLDTSGNLYSILLSNSGTVSPVQPITAAPDPDYLMTADVNGDGINDLIVLDVAYSGKSDPGGIYVFLSNGDGTFRTPKIYNPGVNGTGATMVDVNGDGNIDIVVSTGGDGSGGAASNGLGVLLGNGDGTFKTAKVGSSIGGQYVAAGDFNGDGKPDLVFSSGVIQLGNGDGTFKASTFTMPGPLNGGVPAVGDFNNDGHIDVAINSPNNYAVALYNGKGDGTFTAGRVYAGIYGTVELGAADLDGDGNVDLVMAVDGGEAFAPDPNSYQELQILMGYGDGTFNAAPAYLNATPANFAVGDFNGDGKVDVLGAQVTFVNQTNGLQLLTGDGKGNFAAQTATGLGNPTFIATADMNGDKKLDAVIADSGTALGIALGNGKGGFGAVKDYTLPDSGTISSLATGDFNGDGIPDVVVLTTTQSGSGALYLYLNNGDGTLKAPQQIDTPPSPYSVALADLNGDGNLDIVMTNYGATGGNGGVTQGSVQVYLGKGGGTFAPPASYSPGYLVESVAIGDLNKDGKPDLVVTSLSQDLNTATLTTYLGKGDGTFQTGINTALGQSTAGNMAIADFDGDGDPDVVIGSCCGLADTILLWGNGDGTFPDFSDFLIGISSSYVASADINGDGHPDILLATANGNAQTVNIETLLNSGQAATAKSASTTGLKASAATAAAGTSITLTATVSGATATPTGTVTFMDGSTTLGTGTLDAGEATYSTSSLVVGSHSITAVYGGDSNFSASTSSAVTVVITAAAPGDFTVALSPTSSTVAQGASATTTVSITPAGEFNSEVSFACSGLPANSSCAFSPATVTPTGSTAATTTLTIATGTSTSALRKAENPMRGRHSGGTTSLAFLLGAGAFSFALFRARRKSGIAHYLSLALVTLFTALALTGCGGGSKTKTSGGTYQVTVTASAGTDTHTASYSLTIQ